MRGRWEFCNTNESWGHPFPTVDGRNPAPAEVGRPTHYLQGLIHHRWFFRISSINSSECLSNPILKISVKIGSSMQARVKKTYLQPPFYFFTKCFNVYAFFFWQRKNISAPVYPDPSIQWRFQGCTGSNPSIGGSLGILRVVF